MVVGSFWCSEADYKKFWVVSDSFGWFQVVLDGFGWFAVLTENNVYMYVCETWFFVNSKFNVGSLVCFKEFLIGDFTKGMISSQYFLQYQAEGFFW